MIFNTVMVGSRGTTALSTMDHTWLARSMEKVLTAGMMEVNILESGMKIKLKALAPIAG